MHIFLGYLVAGQGSKKAKTIRKEAEKYKHISLIEVSEESLLKLKHQDITLDDLISAKAPLTHDIVATECIESDGFEVAKKALFRE